MARKQPVSKKHDLRVVFIHGLESTPHGNKYRFLKKKFKHVRSVSMHTGIFNGKRNSFLVAIWREMAFYKLLANVMLFIILGFTIWQYTSLKPMIRFCSLFPMLLLFSSRSLAILKQVKFDTVRSILNDCIEIQSEAIKKFEPDVVVASSFGAAVALFGLLEQRFHIPLVLCASAHESAHSVWFNDFVVWDGDGAKEVFGRNRVSNYQKDTPIVIIHGSDDSVVPVKHSRRLYDILKNDDERKKMKTYTKYHEIHQEGHRLRSILTMASSIQDGETLLETCVLRCAEHFNGK